MKTQNWWKCSRETLENSFAMLWCVGGSSLFESKESSSTIKNYQRWRRQQQKSKSNNTAQNGIQKNKFEIPTNDQNEGKRRKERQKKNFCNSLRLIFIHRFRNELYSFESEKKTKEIVCSTVFFSFRYFVRLTHLHTQHISLCHFVFSLCSSWRTKKKTLCVYTHRI